MASIAGISDHTGWAVAVVADGAGQVHASRRIELVGEGLPTMPYHGPGQRLPLGEGVALVEQVRASAQQQAAARLDELARLVPGLAGIALRTCPQMPPTIAATLQDYWAQTRADGVMYRQALAEAAVARGWSVYWFDKPKLPALATGRLGEKALVECEKQAAATFGPPWNADHRMAFHAAVAARAGEG